MSVFRIIDIFYKRTFSYGLTSVTNIRNAESCSTDFLNKVRTMLITVTAELAILGGSPDTILSADSFRSAVKTIFTGIERKSRMTGGNLRKIISYFPGNSRWTFT